MTNEIYVHNALIITQLTLERCQFHMSHLNALLHLCMPGDNGLDEMVAANARQIIALVGQELAASAGTLETLPSACIRG